MEGGFKFLPSQLLHKLQTISIQKLELEDEDKSMHHLLSVMVDRSEMNDIAAVRHLNLAMLSSYELPGKQTIASTFYPTAVVTFTKLMTLRLGKACLDQQNGPDERGKLDVDYFIQSIPKWQRLRTLELPGLGLTAENAGDILEASSKCPSLQTCHRAVENQTRFAERTASPRITCPNFLWHMNTDRSFSLSILRLAQEGPHDQPLSS
jgi:hypothetical protein